MTQPGRDPSDPRLQRGELAAVARSPFAASDRDDELKRRQEVEIGERRSQQQESFPGDVCSGPPGSAVDAVGRPAAVSSWANLSGLQTKLADQNQAHREKVEALS